MNALIEESLKACFRFWKNIAVIVGDIPGKVSCYSYFLQPLLEGFFDEPQEVSRKNTSRNPIRNTDKKYIRRNYKIHS